MDSISERFKNHRLYGDFCKIKDRLSAHNFVCWVAGGAVRDLLLDRKTADFDLVTDAHTENLKVIFPEALLVGESFGVLKIPTAGGDIFDLATFREESDYLDGRRPSKVSASTPYADSLRRDFTVNSIFWDDESRILRDFQGGQADLCLKTLRAVGVAEHRFEEDKLRILRLVRFAAQLRFVIEDQTQSAALKYIGKLDQISGERIWTELRKIDESGNWGFVANNPIWTSVIEYILETPCEFDRLNLFKRSQIATLLIVAILHPDKDFSMRLKERLKVSNKDLDHYRDVMWVLSQGQYLEPAELIYELEKNAQRKNIFWNLSELGMLPFGLFRSISDLFQKIEAPWFCAGDLLSIVPSTKIGMELRLCRIAQLKKDFQSKDQCLLYLVNKYAKN